MPTPTTIPIDAVPHQLLGPVLTSYRKLLLQEDRLLTYDEAAWLYGYKNHSLRLAVCRGRLNVVKKGRGIRGQVLLRHTDIRAYIQGRKKSGRPREAMRQAQQLIA